MANTGSMLDASSAVSSTAEFSKSSRRKACNQCKQQKLRCDLSNLEPSKDRCSRCERFGLQCRIDLAFQRVLKRRRRSLELEAEVQTLRQQLRERTATTQSDSQSSTWLTHDLQSPESGSVYFSPGHDPTPRTRSRARLAAVGSINRVLNNPTSPSEAPGLDGPIPGLTTKPNIDGSPIEHRSSTVNFPCPRSLDNTVLSVEEIDRLFMVYITTYHPYLPLIDPSQSPHDCYATSELLFWTIISVAARRIKPTLLARLARSVTDLLWRSLRSVPYSLAPVQALVILCTWPFPTNSSTADPTFMLAGVMLQLGVQMGLHQALDVQDFVKVPLRLSPSEFSQWVRTWSACNIVAQSVSIGCGLPLIVQIQAWDPSGLPNYFSRDEFEISISQYFRINQFRHRVSQALGSNTQTSESRITAYRELHIALSALEAEMAGCSDIIQWSISAARLHLEAFRLLDDSGSTGYHTCIMALYETSSSLLNLSSRIQVGDSCFFDHCPFFCSQVYVCAAFVVLKISMNGFFTQLIDSQDATRLLDDAILALRRISAGNNDIPARLGDVIAFFCALPDPSIIGGRSIDELRLKRVKNRLSMSVVYDSLWIWRTQFRSVSGDDENENSGYEPERMRLGTDDILDTFGLGNSFVLDGSPNFQWPEL